MARTDGTKATALRETRTLHRNPERIRDPLFLTHPFFDPRDLLQVRYEMVRRIRVDRQTIARTAVDFGVSRPTVYITQRKFRERGLPGLLQIKSGPKGPRKILPEVLEFLAEIRAKEGSVPYRELAQRVEERFGQTVDASTLYRALQGAGKKTRRVRPPRLRKRR